MQTPAAGNPAATNHLSEILADQALCAERPLLARLAWLAYCSNCGAPAIQHQLPKLPNRPVRQ